MNDVIDLNLVLDKMIAMRCTILIEILLIKDKTAIHDKKKLTWQLDSEPNIEQGESFFEPKVISDQ